MTSEEIQYKLSERKTVHQWLNHEGIPYEENGKPICLLRRISILLDEYRKLKMEIENKG
jgi:hypothetical protein